MILEKLCRPVEIIAQVGDAENATSLLFDFVGFVLPYNFQDLTDPSDDVVSVRLCAVEAGIIGACNDHVAQREPGDGG